MADLFTPAEPKAEERNWTPFIVGLVAVVIVVALIVVVSRNKARTTTQPNPYAAKLQLSNPKMSAAENYVGGTVTYLDVNITNTGDEALVGAAMKLVFKNSMNEVVQTETLPLHVLVENQMGGYPDLVDLGRLPIGPGQTQDRPHDAGAHLCRLEPELSRDAVNGFETEAVVKCLQDDSDPEPLLVYFHAETSELPSSSCCSCFRRSFRPRRNLRLPQQCHRPHRLLPKKSTPFWACWKSPLLPARFSTTRGCCGCGCRPITARRATRIAVYPVLYLQDGQNLFDEATSDAGEWHVDETVDHLVGSFKIPPMIVVGIDYPGQNRSSEYLPYSDPHHKQYDVPVPKELRGKEYAAFLLAEVMPFIEKKYRVSRGAANTGIGGASYGAVISLYTALQHPGIFGHVLLESPVLGVGDGQLLKDAETRSNFRRRCLSPWARTRRTIPSTTRSSSRAWRSCRPSCARKEWARTG